MNLAPNLIAMLVAANLFRKDGCLLGNTGLKKKDKKRTLKPKHIEIGGSRVNFFASCLKDLHVSSNRNSSYVYKNHETVRVDQYENRRDCTVLLSLERNKEKQRSFPVRQSYSNHCLNHN